MLDYPTWYQQLANTEAVELILTPLAPASLHSERDTHCHPQNLIELCTTRGKLDTHSVGEGVVRTPFLSAKPRGDTPRDVQMAYHENAYKYFLRKTGETFPDGDPKAISERKWWLSLVGRYTLLCV